jgi:hypothetical protein
MELPILSCPCHGCRRETANKEFSGGLPLAIIVGNGFDDIRAASASPADAKLALQAIHMEEAYSWVCSIS